MAGIRDVYENSLAVFFQFERFRMSRKFDSADLLAVCRVDNSDSATRKSDVDLFCSTIETNIVGIILEIYFSNGLIGFCVVDFENPAFVVRNEEAIQLGNINETLW